MEVSLPAQQSVSRFNSDDGGMNLPNFEGITKLCDTDCSRIEEVVGLRRDADGLYCAKIS